MSRFLTLALALPLSLAACSDSSTPENAPETVAKAAPSAQAETPAPEAPALANAELAELVRTIEPKVARNGSLRFSDENLVQPAAAPLLLARLQSGADSEAIRHALIIALPQTQGEYAAEAVSVLKNERSEMLRAALVDSMRLAGDSKAALEGLALGMADSAPAVRIRAAFAIGRRADGLDLGDRLVAALSDSDVELQATAARALGNLGAVKAFDSLAPLTQSRDADVRLESLRALGRVDADRAAALPELAKLTQDSDERIRTAATKVANKGY
jgi:HEAT repeat protein